MENLYLITVIKEPQYDDYSCGVEVAGLVEESKKEEARKLIENFLEEEGYDEAEIFVTEYIPNQIRFYEIEKNL